MVASGGVIDTVSVSSLAKSLAPKALAAAICNVMACTETFTAGTAMRSLGLKSLMVLMSGSRLLSRNGCELSAEMPRTSCGVPLVCAHSVSRPGTPPEPISILPDISASLTAVGPLNLNHDTFTSGMPSALACFSMSCLMLHHVELQVAHGKLLGQPDFRHLGRGRRQQAEQRGRTGHSAEKSP